MEAFSYKCPNCGGDLKFDPKSGKFECEYCASSFSAEEAQTFGTDQEADLYICPSCGAEIVTEATTAATFCYYCHNPVILKGRLSGEYRPDLVIPFAIDRKSAVDQFLAYVKKKYFVPRAFFSKEQIEKISGVYFPFWMYSCKSDGWWKGNGRQVRVYRIGDMEYTETKVFDVSRRAELDFEKLTRNALNRENRELVEAVQPFRLEEAVSFSMGYLSGFQAEKRDIEKSELKGGLEQEIRQHTSDMIKSRISGYQMLEASAMEADIREEDWRYLLLPVWVLTYQGKDQKRYYYAMNGQTGKISGKLPLDKKKLLALFAGIFFMVLFLMLWGFF